MNGAIRYWKEIAGKKDLLIEALNNKIAKHDHITISMTNENNERQRKNEETCRQLVNDKN